MFLYNTSKNNLLFLNILDIERRFESDLICKIFCLLKFFNNFSIGLFLNKRKCFQISLKGILRSILVLKILLKMKKIKIF
jgi:hypothetical protein